MLRFGTFIRVIKKGLAESSDEEVVNLLMRPLWDDESEYIDPAVVSKLISGNRKIKSAFRKRAIQPEYIKRVEINFRQRVVFNEETRYITINEIKHLVSSDDSIPQAKKDEWLGITTDLPTLLTKVFLYVIGLDNQKLEDQTKHTLSAKLNFAQSKLFGRRDELKKIAILVDEGHKPIVIWGEGGIGKTELALQFCKELKTHECHFVQYHNSLKDTIASLSFSNTPENHKKLSVEEKFEKHIKWLEEYDDTNLLILDNFDDDSKTLTELLADQDLARICRLRFKLIITTRNKPQFPMPNAIHLESLPETELLELITHYYQRWEADGTTDDELRALIRALDGHTLCCELAAKTLQASHNLKPKDVLESLHDNNEDSLAIVDTEKDRRGYSGKITDHIKKLYTISSLTAEEIETMRYMLLTAPSGIDHSLLLDVNFGIKAAPLQGLIRRGWLKKAFDTDLITMHPVIRSFCILTEPLRPTLIEEKFLDFIDVLYAWTAQPAFRYKAGMPKEALHRFFREWSQVKQMTWFLVDSITLLVPEPVTVEQAKSYFVYADTFLNVRQTRSGPSLPWEIKLEDPRRYMAMGGGLGIAPLGWKLSFHMRILAFRVLEDGLPTDDPFWGTVHHHMGQSYQLKASQDFRDKQATERLVHKHYLLALACYFKEEAEHVSEIVSILKWFSQCSFVRISQKLCYAQQAVALMDKYGVGEQLTYADFCNQIAWIYMDCVRAGHNYQVSLRADRRHHDGLSVEAREPPVSQLSDLQAALHWLLRAEQAYLKEYADISDTASISMRANKKNHEMSALYEKIGGICYITNDIEKELKYRIQSAYYANHCSFEGKICGEAFQKYLSVCLCQHDLRLYADCFETCRKIIKQLAPEMHLPSNNRELLISACDVAIDCCCKLEKYDEAISIWGKMYDLGLQNDSSFVASSLRVYTNIVICYRAQKNIEKQCYFETKILEAKILNTKKDTAISQQEYIYESIDIAKKLIKQKYYSTARDILYEVEEYYNRPFRQQELLLPTDTYLHLAKCLKKIGDKNSAKKYLLMYADSTGRNSLANLLRKNLGLER